MSYPISSARQYLFDNLQSLTGVQVYDAIAPDDLPGPYVTMDAFTLQPADKCSANVTCNISVWNEYNKRGGNLEIDVIMDKIYRFCEIEGSGISITSSGVRTFNRAMFRQQLTVTFNFI